MNDTLHAVALSVVSSPSLTGIWDHVASDGPAELYDYLSMRSKLLTQDYLWEKYSRDPLSAAEEIVRAAEAGSVKILHYWDDDYPRMLKETARPPLALYELGGVSFGESVAVVGSRRADPRSKMVARRICSRLAAAGYTVVSGMAMGIDREAHEATLDSSGSTIGVMANGIDIRYPSSNSDLYNRIVSTPGSGLVSEYPPGTLTRKWTFVRRNRIISGLSLATVVVKAGARSGALITAGYALEQNRELFACTGHSLDPDYEGCLRLIQKGAFAVASEDDIVSELRSRGSVPGLFSGNTHARRRAAAAACAPLPFEGDGEVSKKLLSLLRDGERDIDYLVRTSGFPVNIVNEAIIVLELSGRIVKNGSIVAAV